MNTALRDATILQPQRLLNTVESSCIRLGIKRTTMFRLLKENQIKAVKAAISSTPLTRRTMRELLHAGGTSFPSFATTVISGRRSSPTGT